MASTRVNWYNKIAVDEAHRQAKNPPSSRATYHRYIATPPHISPTAPTKASLRRLTARLRGSILRRLQLYLLCRRVPRQWRRRRHLCCGHRPEPLAGRWGSAAREGLQNGESAKSVCQHGSTCAYSDGTRTPTTVSWSKTSRESSTVQREQASAMPYGNM